MTLGKFRIAKVFCNFAIRIFGYIPIMFIIYSFINKQWQ